MAEVSCERCADLLGEWAEGALAAPERDALEAHIASCIPCAALARDYWSVSAFVRRLTDVELPPDAQARLRERSATFLRRKR